MTELSSQYLDVDTRTSNREVQCLYSLAKSASQGAIVEIGSWKGNSTLYLAKGTLSSGKGNKVYAIDPHIFGTELIFRENVKKAGVAHVVVPLVVKSEESVRDWSLPISLLFIDGLHDYENVKKDFLLWEPWVMKGGIIAFHDRLAEGIIKVIREYVLRGSGFSKVRVVEGILYATKGVNLNFGENLNNFKLLILSYLVTAFHLTTRPRQLQGIRRAVIRLRRKLLYGRT